MRVAGENRGPVPERLRCLQVVLATDGAELEARDESGYTAVRTQNKALGNILKPNPTRPFVCSCSHHCPKAAKRCPSSDWSNTAPGSKSFADPLTISEVVCAHVNGLYCQPGPAKPTRSAPRTCCAISTRRRAGAACRGSGRTTARRPGTVASPRRSVQVRTPSSDARTHWPATTEWWERAACTAAPPWSRSTSPASRPAASSTTRPPRPQQAGRSARHAAVAPRDAHVHQ